MNTGIFALPDSIKTEQWFYAQGAGGAISTTKNWQQWTKPKNCQFVLIKGVGAGAGGGNGFSGSAASNRGGGGGGGSGATASALFLSSMLPDILWVQIPRGGTAGQVGGRVVVSLTKTTAATDVLFLSGASDAAAGGNGTASAAGTAGSGSTALTITTPAYLFLALGFTAQSGTNGAAGGAHTGAAGTTVSQAYPVSGGSGGAGINITEFAGGAQTGVGAYQFQRPTIAGGTSGGGSGLGGHNMFGGFFLNSGGTGGGSSNSGTGGNGGNGGFGSGGGGGGAGVTGGTGGTGGDGLGLIVTW